MQEIFIKTSDASLEQYLKWENPSCLVLSWLGKLEIPRISNMSTSDWGQAALLISASTTVFFQ